MTSTSHTHPSLLSGLRRQHEPSWERLVDLFGPMVYAMCRRSGLGSEAAADVMQETFLSVSKSLEKFKYRDSSDTFRGWLWTITRNKVRDHFRALAGRPDAQGGTTAQLQLQQVPDEAPSDTDDTTGEHLHSKLARRAVALMQTDFEETT